MSTTITCQGCGSPFEPSKIHGEVQCPVCGTLQESTEGELALLDTVRPVPPKRDQATAQPPVTEAPAPPPSTEATVVEPNPLKEPPKKKESSLDEGFFDQATQIGTSTPSTANRVARSRTLSVMGPSLALCAAFLLWVGYDKEIRSPRMAASAQRRKVADDLILESLRSFDRGELGHAAERARAAVETDPDSLLARELYTLIQTAQATPTPLVP
jgi:uncharacterized Zn finger protein (UPF0148 family)